MDRPRLPLGDYYQLLQKHGLLADRTPLAADLTRPVTAVTCDSRAAVPGSLFICKGEAFKAEYLAEALRRGAVAYVSETPYDLPAPCVRVTDIRAAMGLLADRAWGHPSGALSIVGITGTKGKTTTTYFLKSILDLWREAQGLHAIGMLSSVDTDDGLQRGPSKLTTPEPLDLQRHLWNAANAGCGYVVMEESSQALKYGRVVGVDLAAAVFLNIGEDHVSPREHPDLEDYFNSKLKIFEQTDTAVVNLDSDRADRVLAAARRCKTVYTYSLKDPSADFYGRGLSREGSGFKFYVNYMGEEQSFAIPMAGGFNVSNALAALAVCGSFDVPAEFVRAGLARVRVPGRMETYVNNGRTVVVDYAHNGMSLAALLRSAREDHPGHQVTVVFGCTGGKGLDRREGMGRAAAQYADRIILTEDDPGPEDVEEICADVGRYITAMGRTFEVIPDRDAAIRSAIEGAALPAVILVAGKGREIWMRRKNGPEPCAADGMIALKYLGLPMDESLL